MRLGDAQIGHQKSHRLGSHDLAAVGMDGELPGGNLVFADGFFDELPGQFGAFSRRHHPAGDVATEDVQDDVEIKVGPFGGPHQLGNIPTPELIGSSGQQFVFGVGRVGKVIPALPRFALASQEPVHRSNRARISAFIE